MIDLHTHTYYSDGTLSPDQLVKLAKERGIETLAITDHDGVDGLEEGGIAARECGICLIHGVELSAQLSSDEQPSYMHILGYDFDRKNPAFLKKLEEIREKRKERNNKLIRALADLGYKIDPADVQVYPGQDYIGKPNFARALVKRGYAPDVAAAFASEHMLAAPAIKGIRREKMEASESIRLIREAGGIAVLAHPMKVTYKGKAEANPEVFLCTLEHIVSRLTALGLSGMECYYSTHTKDETKRLLAMAEHFGLCVTAGSDFHGPDMKKGVQLGDCGAPADFRR